ncbi:SUN domain-containing ossification factor isoform X3 [Nerophis ophidion]|uniref:SUN domain-containing ossification factor isoform X3 n=1 Tax=Nerophis ophidion TaxID=159077 RepID=UPI002ADFC9FF|nr:SUN domain-containing ossification factor isoform X3 [Nerophis ophidion]
MKRLRVVLVCLIVALLCRYPSQHAYCSEHSLSGPGEPAEDRDNIPVDRTHQQDSAEPQEVEEWTTHTSYTVGQEAETAAHNVHQQQTVNPHGAEEEANSESDIVPVANEPEPSADRVVDSDPQTKTRVQYQDRDQEAPVSSTLELISASEDAPRPDKLLDADSATAAADSDPVTIPHEADNTPTSESAAPTHTGEDKADTEDQQSDQNQDSGPEAVAESSAGREEQEREEGQADTEPENNLPASQHQEQQAATGRESDPSVPSKDDIPTFDEWKKQVMEVEKEKSQSLHTAASGSTQSVKKVQKNFKNNYASVECGAKILSANNEAKSTSAILMENMDLYMLNPCSNKIWFVIELCERIQVKQLDLANFELFSSTPKDFVVSLSDRYPTNKWVKLGTFHARDERIIQSFPLDEQLYAKYVKMFIKYIKVELLSHFGSEHFCPLSLFRVFGTSMVEEYDEADSQDPSERLEYLVDEDYDYPPGYQPSEDKASKNLLGSATNAILNMVNNIAANVLGGKPELQEEGAQAEGNVTAEVVTDQEGGLKVTLMPPEITGESSAQKPEEPTTLKDWDSSSVSSASSSLLPHTDRQIVTLVEEEDDEEHHQSTVTLMEEEGDEEEEKKAEEAADRHQWESQLYCPGLPLSSLSLSCMATLPELLHRWCSAVLAKERLRRLRAQTRPRVKGPALTQSTIQVPDPASTPLPEALPLTETSPEMEAPLKSQSEVSPTPHVDSHTPQLDFLLEPSRTSTLHPHSLSDPHSSLTRPTPTHEYVLLPPIKDAALNPAPTPPLQVAAVPETKLSSVATTFITSLTQQLLTQETSSPDAALLAAKEQPVQALPTASKPEDLVSPPTEQPAAPPLTDSDAIKSGEESRDPHKFASLEEQADPLPQGGEPQDTGDEDLLHTNGNVHRTATDFYAEMQNGGDYSGGAANGATVHGSSQKESVFMRLNNRIKALEMNMSLSSRYLEELSQRYRKQMEEMQRAFNKTIIKLQNTSRIAEEQDQKQQDSIQVLQSQLENVTKLMLNLTVTINQLQKEVSDRQSYLVVSLALCVSLGLLMCLQCCRSSSAAPKDNTAALPKSNHYPSPKRCFSSYDDMSLKRRVTCPLVRSKSFHLSSTEVGPDDLYIVEPLRFSPEKKKKRCKSKSLDKVETLKASDPPAPLFNGEIKCNGFHACLPLPALPQHPPSPLPLPPPPPPPPPLPEMPSLPPRAPTELPSETSSCSSSTHSEESFATRLPPPSPVFSSSGLCNGHRPPPAKSRQERRSTKRRKSRQTELTFPPMPEGGVASLASLQQLMKGGQGMGVGTIRVTAVSGHV